MNTSEPRQPVDILNDLYNELQSDHEESLLTALAQLSTLRYSSEAIRQKVEKLSVQSTSPNVRAEALSLLNSSANRNIQRRSIAHQLDLTFRTQLLQQIKNWEQDELIEMQTAEVLRKRYDFDIAPLSQPSEVSVSQAVSTPIKEPAAPLSEPRPSLLQTLTSEASIKVYLYLGAFFVIAAAAILGAVVPELRLPILLIGTLVFGGLAVGIKKRLPQPSFALFIVFSFLLVITANSLQETLRDSFRLTNNLANIYWALIFLVMTIIWGGGTWLYDSRLFSITAFGSLALAMLRVGNILDAEEPVYTSLMSMTAFAGLGGTWLLKRWRDDTFAIPLFISSQLLQGVTLLASLIIFGLQSFENNWNTPLWNVGHIFTWSMGTLFFAFSNRLFVFFVFPWLAAATLIPIPWFINFTFGLENLGSGILLLGWGTVLSLTSEAMHRVQPTQKYALPILLASFPSLLLAIINGFAHELWLGLIFTLAAAVLLSLLHGLRNRWWLWTLALFNFTVAYFVFFHLDAIQSLDIFFGYQLAGIIVLFLLPDLIFQKDWSAVPAWRLHPRIYGAFFAVWLSIFLPSSATSTQAAIGYGILTVLFTLYALAYKKALLGYLPTAYLTVTTVYALNSLQLDLWLPALSSLSVLYYLSRIILRSSETWAGMFRNSALALGTILSFSALILSKDTGGWYALGMGLLFGVEMYLHHEGRFEVGTPILFTLGTYLILQEFGADQIPYQLLTYSLIWLLTDLLAHLTFTAPRPLSMVTRFFGAVFSLLNFGFLLSEDSATVAAIGFGIYTLLFLTISLLYRHPTLFYAFTVSLPLFTIFLFKLIHINQWIHPVIVLAVAYYALGYVVRKRETLTDWGNTLLNSGLGVGVIVSIAAPILGRLDASLPVAIAATLWAIEAFAKRNAWLAFPANALYLLSYFIILFELDINEPQFFSIGTALFGLIQHYLLTRATSKTGTFIMGMFSQFVLLGTTYIEMVNKNELSYFFLLFIQSMIVLVYGLVIRSRSLTFFPIGFVVLGVVTVVYSALKGIGTIFVIGCTGILLLMLGIAAVLLRERIAKLGEKLSDWKA